MKRLFSILILAGLTSMIACTRPSETAQSTTSDTVQTKTDVSESTTIETWKKIPTVDEFGDAIPDKFSIVGLFEGKMSNSATAGAELIVKIARQIDDKGKIIFFTEFFEYGSPPAARLDDGERTLRIKLADGSVKQIRQYAYESTLYDSDLVFYKLITSQKEPFKVVVEFGSTTYNYEVNPVGFAELTENKSF